MIKAQEVEKIQGSAKVDIIRSSFQAVSQIYNKQSDTLTLLHFPEPTRFTLR
jgi:hypothetical protein